LIYATTTSELSTELGKIEFVINIQDYYAPTSIYDDITFDDIRGTDSSNTDDAVRLTDSYLLA